MQDQRYATPDRRATICLIIDVANIPEDAIMPLVQELRRRGSLAAMFAFGDWHRRDMHLRHRLLDALGFLCIHGGSWENGSGGLKSMVDSIMKRTIKWMPQWFPTCDTYVLATGDRDFSHDASDLRWRGFQVWIAAGEASINNELRLGADEFISLDRLPGRATPAAVLGVPAGYYEQTFGARRPYRTEASAAPAETAPPPTRVTPPAETALPAMRATPPPARPAPTPAVAPRPTTVAAAPAPAPVAAAPVVVAPAPAPAVTPPVSEEDRALLAQLRELAGPRGYVAQREALRALAPADDPGGRVRSRLSNQIRDLLERGQLVRSHAMIGGNLTQVLALPGVVVATDTFSATPDDDASDRRSGRRRGVRRPRSASGSETPEATDLEVEPPIDSEPVAIAELATATPVAVEAATPAAPVVPIRPTPPEVVPAQIAQRPAPMPDERPIETPRPTMLPSDRPAEPPRPAARRVEAPIVRPDRVEPSAPPPVAPPSLPRPSWRDQVAAALAQVRGEPDGNVTPATATVPVVVAPPVAPPMLAPMPPEVATVVDEPIVADVAQPVVADIEPADDMEAADTPEPADEPSGEAAPARRRRRRRPASSTPAVPAASDDEAETVATVIAEALPLPMSTEEVGEDTPATNGDEPARRRPPRRRRRPTSAAEAAPEPAGV